ncbi:MAG: molecular chaperone [Bacteroidota bacterium]|nr:molecular chaperone [Bacteroidota bacterium]
MAEIVIANTTKSRTLIGFKGIFFLFFIGFSLLCSSLMAQGNLLISPHRIVFEGQKRTMEINLANTGQDSAKYSISFLQYRMAEDGSYQEITAPEAGLNFADKNVRFFPRTVMLGPNESQVVKLQLTKADELAPGEYRSHLYFRALSNQKALGEETAKKDTTGISIKIVAVFGITVPVIIRVGESTTATKLTDLKLEKGADGNHQLLLAINRTGNMSTYGDLTITHIAPNGAETQIGVVNGIAVYTPLALRRVKVDLDNKPAVDLSKGKIRAVYSSQSDTHPVKLAEAELTL